MLDSELYKVKIFGVEHPSIPLSLYSSPYPSLLSISSSQSLELSFQLHDLFLIYLFLVSTCERKCVVVVFVP